MPTVIRGGLLAGVIAALSLAAVGAAAEPTVIKVATVTPEGSTWTNILYRFAEEARQRTGGAVEFKIYAGGISGDELDVLRKMRANRIQAAGFSGVGLGVLLPEIRILEAPLLFRDDQELDYVKSRLFDRFAAGFERQGYRLLGFVEAGFVYFFAKTDLSATDALGRVKMWSWKGDPVAQTFLETFGIRTVPLHVTDVTTGLETGMIDAFYAPPLAALAFQWYARIGYMLDFPMVNSTGALLMNLKDFNQLSPQFQAVLVELADRHCRELVRLSRKENQEAVSIFSTSGIQRVRPTAEQIEALGRNAVKTYEKNIPGLYSRELYQQVQQLLAEHRAKP